MSTIRGVKDRRYRFVQILNSMLEDKNLSLKAKGFISFCLSKPENWNFHISHFCNVLKEGEKAIYSVINECIQNGYAYRYQTRENNGKFLIAEFIISDSKIEIQATKKELESLDKLKKSLPDPQNVDADNPRPQKGEAVLGEENRGSSNTDSSNRRKQQHVQQQAVDVAASISKEKKKKAIEPKIYLFLESLDIPDIDKMEITRRYSEEVAKNALEFTVASKNKIKTTFIAYFKMSCQRGLKIENKSIPDKSSSQEVSQEQGYANKMVVTNFIKSNWENYELRCAIMDKGNRVRIGNDDLYFDNPKFKVLFDHYVRKLEILL